MAVPGANFGGKKCGFEWVKHAFSAAAQSIILWNELPTTLNMLSLLLHKAWNVLPSTHLAVNQVQRLTTSVSICCRLHILL